jgi:high-affinity nickel-transport protein
MTRSESRLRPAILPLTVLAAANLAAWLWAWQAFADRPSLLGSAMLAWLFGLRHAADADHLAAIDNVVRKLVQDGKNPGLTGLYFSLGHASVVVIASAVIAVTASGATLDRFQPVAAAGTAVSIGFLLLIALVNLRTLVALLRGSAAAPAGGLLARAIRPAIALISRPAHMFPLGFLFGLGFDTATEVGLLALAATQAAAGVSFFQVLVFPALFTAGMALVDTADSVLMTGAYRWAFIDPARKQAYNVTVTVLSIAIALIIGGIEAIGLLADHLGLRDLSAFDDAALPANDLGYAIVALFAATWAAFAFRYHRRKAAAYDPAVGPSRKA